MFGHQEDEHHHHDGDQQPVNDTAMQPAVDGVLSGDDHAQHDDFNPALPPQDASAPVVADDTASSPEPVTEPVFQAAPVAGSDDLLAIKQQALTSLTPLVGHLDQTPEEKFRTTMMLIQASDNQSLLKDAYDAAQNIADEKVKAQALLDVVNEINYFTQQNA